MKKLIGYWHIKTIPAIVLGAVLVGLLSVYIRIPVFKDTYVNLAPIIIVIIGAYFGPLAAGLAACFGNMFTDLLSEWGMWFDWSIGYFVCGMIMGCFDYYGASIKQGIFDRAHQKNFAFTAIIGNLVGFCVITPILTQFWYKGELSVGIMQGIVALLSNSAILIIIGMPILTLLARRNHLKKQK